MSDPNPFDDVGPWNQVLFAGVLVKALLTKIDDVETKDEWKKQKSKESSGQVNVFAGTTVSDPKLTFTAVDREDFDDLRRLWNVLKPVPGLGTGTATTTPAATPAAPGSQFTSKVGSAPAGGATPGTAQAALDSVNPPDPADKKDASSNPGPRPPTVSVQNEILAWHGVYAVARGSWKGPTPTETNAWEVELVLKVQKPPTPAGAGAMAPATPQASPGQQYTTAGAPGAAPTPQSAVQANASAQANGV